MHRLFYIIIIITCFTLFASSVKASINDCINQLIPFGISHDRAEKACSKACVSGEKKILQSELNRLCQAAKTGNGGTIYYSNGNRMTSYAGQKGATWYYPNGNRMTSYAGQEGATWYHSDGSVITSSGNLMSSEEMLYPCSYIE